jgi:hypothetical protein
MKSDLEQCRGDTKMRYIARKVRFLSPSAKSTCKMPVQGVAATIPVTAKPPKYAQNFTI